jgi:hypothetical protein
MPQQRELHGEAQAIRVPAPHGQKFPVGSGEARCSPTSALAGSCTGRDSIRCLPMRARATRLDRLGRSLGELLATVAMLRSRGIAMLSLEEKINTASAAGELVFHVFGAIAHFERRLIAERTKDGIAAARARGGRGVNRSMPTRSRRR